MSQPLAQRQRTVDELYAMPDNGAKYELQAGVLLAEPLPGYRHGRIAMRLGATLDAHVRRHALGDVLAADTGFVLARDPDTVRGPDVSFVRRERLVGGLPPVGAFDGPPDLAVEVLSPSSTPAEVHAKVADYLAAGTRCVWVIDPDREQATVYRSLLGPRVLSPEDDLDGEDVVPGFRTRVGALFET